MGPEVAARPGRPSGSFQASGLVGGAGPEPRAAPRAGTLGLRPRRGSHEEGPLAGPGPAVAQAGREARPHGHQQPALPRRPPLSCWWGRRLARGPRTHSGGRGPCWSRPALSNPVGRVPLTPGDPSRKVWASLLAGRPPFGRSMAPGELGDQEAKLLRQLEA